MREGSVTVKCFLIHKGFAWYSKRTLGKVIDGLAVKLGW